MAQVLLVLISVSPLAMVLTILWVSRCRTPRPRPLLPPGPKPLPIIGNVLDIPTQDQWKTFANWSITHRSDVIYARLFGRSLIILNSVKSTVDLLNGRSHIYSDRTQSNMIQLLSWGSSFIFLPYGPEWRVQRRLFYHYFNKNAVKKYQPVQLGKIRDFLALSLKHPQKAPENVRKVVTSIICRLVYGMNISLPMGDHSADGSTNVEVDDYVRIAEKAMLGVSAAMMPGTAWVDYVPFLMRLPSWMPGNRTIREMQREYKGCTEDLRNKPYEFVKRAMNKGEAADSVLRSIIEEKQSYDGKLDPAAAEGQETIEKNVAAAAYIGGADTVTATTHVFMLAMAMYPEVQTKAQAELDRVISPHQFPEFHHVESLVYVRAVFMEVLRWLPIGIFTPHQATKDDTYEGYFIPKGAIVIVNNRYLLHNPIDYPDPEVFKPERYIGIDGELDPTVLNPEMIAFGFGRRVCPGKHLAKNTALLLIASMLHVFNITAGVDDHGNPIKLSTRMSAGIVSTPLDVPRGLNPRSEAAVRLILEAVGPGNVDQLPDI